MRFEFQKENTLCVRHQTPTKTTGITLFILHKSPSCDDFLHTNTYWYIVHMKMYINTVHFTIKVDIKSLTLWCKLKKHCEIYEVQIASAHPMTHSESVHLYIQIDFVLTQHVIWMGSYNSYLYVYIWYESDA